MVKKIKKEASVRFSTKPIAEDPDAEDVDEMTVVTKKMNTRGKGFKPFSGMMNFKVLHSMTKLPATFDISF